MHTELSFKEIGHRIYFIRERRVMLDSDLAMLYLVQTKQLNLKPQSMKGVEEGTCLMFLHRKVLQCYLVCSAASVQFTSILLLEHDHEFESVFEAIRRLMATGLPVTQKKVKGLAKD